MYAAVIFGLIVTEARSRSLLPRLAAGPSMAEPCCKCRYCAEFFEEVQGRKHGHHFTCKVCDAANRALRRNLGELPEELNTFGSQEREDFYKELADKKREQKGNLAFQSVKAHLCTALTQRRIQEHSKTVKGRFLPQSVWEKKGWTTEQVEASPKEWDEKYGWVYRVDVKELTWTDTFQKVQETLLALEEKVLAKKKGKKSVDLFGLPSLAVDPEPENSEDESTDLSFNRKCVKLCRKLLPGLTLAACSLAAAEQAAQETPEAYTEALQATVKKLSAQASEQKAFLEEVLRRSQAVEVQERLPDASEKEQEITVLLKAARAALKEYKKKTKEHREQVKKRKAEEKAESTSAGPKRRATRKQKQ